MNSFELGKNILRLTLVGAALAACKSAVPPVSTLESDPDTNRLVLSVAAGLTPDEISQSINAQNPECASALSVANPGQFSDSQVRDPDGQWHQGQRIGFPSGRLEVPWDLCKPGSAQANLANPPVEAVPIQPTEAQAAEPSSNTTTPETTDLSDRPSQDSSVSTSPITSEDLADWSEAVQFYAPILFCFAVPVGGIGFVAYSLHEARKPVSRKPTRTKASTSVIKRPEENGDPYYDEPQTSLPASSPDRPVIQIAADRVHMRASTALRGHGGFLKVSVTSIGRDAAYIDIETGDREKVIDLLSNTPALRQQLEHDLGVSHVDFIPRGTVLTVVADNDPDYRGHPQDGFTSPGIFDVADSRGRIMHDGSRIIQEPSGEFTVAPSPKMAKEIAAAEKYLRKNDPDAYVAYIEDGRDPQSLLRVVSPRASLVDESVGDHITSDTRLTVASPNQLRTEASDAADGIDFLETHEVSDEEFDHNGNAPIPHPPHHPLPSPSQTNHPKYIESADDVKRLLR